MAVKPIPEGYTSVTPYLTVADATRALDFYRDAFGAQELFRLPMNGKIGHAEIRIGNATVMLSDEWPEMQALSPSSRGGATSSFVIYTEDTDAAYRMAIAAGATADRAPADQPWGDRMGTVVDPFGHKWMLATHIEDVDPDELKRRMAAGAEQSAVAAA